MQRIQSVAVVVAVVCGVLGLVTSTGCPVLPPGDPEVVGLLHVLVILVGALAGFCVPFRMREIEAERWRVVEQSGLTSGEREYAHKEAESDKKRAGMAFVLAPVTLGFWLAYHFRRTDAVTPADFLMLTPLLGFGLGLVLGWWRSRAGPGGARPS